jgi:hypothetical protein
MPNVGCHLLRIVVYSWNLAIFNGFWFFFP